ncbi:uncharacterized protein LOC115097508 [Rhinatrema bivittatum]|uniref:uncharacterized protein LOC115097508 n=1 Tax=Rhinatrema bivittatum TaxID=194408 RepID=UPI00112A7758|nr:uncharacterized protein LOC115097508 [Rhinatrema bivittatum]XP_029469289.1 uncharacterized protein LOC115097508 [Rhinatrema bivittatum]
MESSFVRRRMNQGLRRLPPLRGLDKALPVSDGKPQAAGLYKVKAYVKPHGAGLERSQDFLKTCSPWAPAKQGHVQKEGGAEKGPALEDPPSEGTGPPPTPRTPSPKKTKVRKILVDLQSALGQVWEAEDSRTGSRESETPASRKEEEGGQSDHITEAPSKSSGATLAQKLSARLPPIQTSSKQEKRAQTVQRKVSLVQVLEDGSLASQSLPKTGSRSPPSFPRVILQPSGKRRITEMVVNENPSRFEFPADLQIPTALLLQQVTEHSSSRNHTLIAQVLCALRQTNLPAAKSTALGPDLTAEGATQGRARENMHPRRAEGEGQGLGQNHSAN